MANAKKLPSGKWRILVYIGVSPDGKKKYKSFTDPDKRKCERMAAEYADAHREATQSNSFGDALIRYIDSRRAVLSPATIRGYKNIQNAFETQYGLFYAAPVQDISKDSLQKMINDMVTTGVSPKTIRNRHGLITAVMKENGYLPPVVKLPDLKKPTLKIPDIDDVKRIIKCAEGTDMEIPILLGAFAPMRRSEIVPLKIDDIDGNIIHVTKAVVIDEYGECILKSTKTYDSTRSIPMPQYIIDKINDRGYVTKIENPQHISQRFEHIAKQAGCKGTRFHDLRHFCASYLHSIGVPEQYILSRGGWTTDGVMKNVYRHTLESGDDRIGNEILCAMGATFFDQK